MNCRPRCICALIVLICILGVPGILSAETIYVDPDGKDGYATIGAAVDAAGQGDTIVINPGTYTGRGNRDVEIRGKSITIQSSDDANAETTIIDCGGTANDPHRAFAIYDSTAEVKGLAITNGLSDAGGAIFCKDSVLAIENCSLYGNATLAGGPGGALCIEDAAVNISGCRIEDNRTGDGVSNKNSSKLGGDGGGLYSSNSVVYISDSTITGNATGSGVDAVLQPGDGGNGGGIYADALVVINSVISNNVCGHGGNGLEGGFGGIGGGIFSSRASIDTSVIEGNAAGSAGTSSTGFKADDIEISAGGGIYCSDAIQIFNSLIAGNRGGSGAGIWCSQGVVNLCTVVGNRGADASGDSKDAVALGAGISCSAETIVTNSILWSNEPDQILGHDCDNVAYCNIEDSDCSGLGMLSQDPLFVTPGLWTDNVWLGGDFHLAADSICIDAGDPSYTPDSAETDLEGRNRLSGTAVDMGAYEQTNLVAVYRFWAPKTSKHFYTIDQEEKDKLISEFSASWTYEGPVYYVFAQASEPGLVPVYRLWSSVSGSHFWTISESERISLLQDASQGWVDEGVVFYVYSEKNAATGTSPVYRFWSDALGSHFYTINEEEKDKLIEEFSKAWTYEGAVWYAFPDLQGGGGETPDTGGDSNVYEFDNGTDAVSFSLGLTAKIDGKPVDLDLPQLVFTSAAGNLQMNVDLDALTTQLNSLRVATERLDFSAVAGDRVSGQGEYAFSLALSGAFDCTDAKGPYEIDSRSLTFPTVIEDQAVGAADTFTISGSAIIEGEKSSIDLTLAATDFDVDGIATFLEYDSSALLDVSMDGPFKWTRQGHEDLLFERTFKDRVLQVYVTAVELRTTGFWNGKQVQVDDGNGKDEKK